MKYPKSVPDDYRRNLWSLETILERAQFYPEGDGDPDTMHVHITDKTADEMTAQLQSTPNNVLIIQTSQGRFQITVSNVMTIVCLDAHSGISVRPTAANTIEVRNF